MSYNALRYRDPERVADIAEYKRQGYPRKMTKHHQPPSCPDKFPRIIKVDERHHRAYHLLLGNPANYEMACAILKRDWWQV